MGPQTYKRHRSWAVDDPFSVKHEPMAHERPLILYYIKGQGQCFIYGYVSLHAISVMLMRRTYMVNKYL